MGRHTHPTPPDGPAVAVRARGAHPLAHRDWVGGPTRCARRDRILILQGARLAVPGRHGSCSSSTKGWMGSTWCTPTQPCVGSHTKHTPTRAQTHTHRDTHTSRSWSRRAAFTLLVALTSSFLDFCGRLTRVASYTRMSRRSCTSPRCACLLLSVEEGHPPLKGSTSLDAPARALRALSELSTS